MASTTVELKLAGSARGTLVVPSLDVTVSELREEIARLTGCHQLFLEYANSAC